MWWCCCCFVICCCCGFEGCYFLFIDRNTWVDTGVFAMVGWFSIPSRRGFCQPSTSTKRKENKTKFGPIVGRVIFSSSCHCVILLHVGIRAYGSMPFWSRTTARSIRRYDSNGVVLSWEAHTHDLLMVVARHQGILPFSTGGDC